MKPQVTYKLDYKKDARNYFDAANQGMINGRDFSKVVLPEIKKRVKGKSWDESRDYLYDLLKNNYERDGKTLDMVKSQISESWKLIEEEFFNRLENVMKKPIYTDNFTAYLTTCQRCPYNPEEDSFRTYAWGSSISERGVAAHKLMHLQFHRYYWDKCMEELKTKKKTDNLKEALTVLLNKEFKDLIMVKDIGYPSHKMLRAHLSSVWDRTKDFDKLLKNGIKYLKR